MDTRFSSQSFSSEHEDDKSSSESQPESLTQFGLLSEIAKETSPMISNRKSRKAAQKRVVSIPIKDSEGTRFKGDGVPPPSDSWAWRKYGQKPIKGSPHPRAYYKCSSSKGCPARKQVERSRDDPTMLVVAYSCEHNHLWPVRKNNHRHQNNQDSSPSNTHSSSDPHLELELRHEEKPLDLFGSGSGSPELDATDGFGWLMGMRNPRSTILESPIYSKGYYEDHRSATKNSGKSSNEETDMAMFFPMREEDESMFSDLGELPECTVVLRHDNNEGFTQLC